MLGMRLRIFVLLAALLVVSGFGPRLASAQSLCETCEVQLGLGGTHHFWGATGGVVLPVTVNWDDSRYELGFFRVTTQQVLHDAHCPDLLMADPYWGMSLSRRWRLYETGPVRVFFGFGFAAKTESDQLSATRLDFAEQLGMRFRLPGNRIVAEFTIRHWSNGGIRLPNHGQDFATLTFRLNTGRVGIGRAEVIPLDGLRSRALVASAPPVAAPRPYVEQTNADPSNESSQPLLALTETGLSGR